MLPLSSLLTCLVPSLVMQLHVPDANGMHGDVVLGKATIQEYVTPDSSPFFGCLVGRFGNRIRGGQFTLDGERSVARASTVVPCLHVVR